MVAIDENLRHGQAATRPLHHGAAQFGIARHVDLLESNALFVEQPFGLHTVGTKIRRIDDDLSHAARTRNLPSHISPDAVLTTRASVNASTRAAPARFNARAQASNVAPW